MDIMKIPGTPGSIGFCIQAADASGHLYWVPMVRIAINGHAGMLTGDQMISVLRDRTGSDISTGPVNRAFGRSAWRRAA